MENIFAKSIYVIIYIVPYLIFRYYPFRKKLRVPIGALITIYAVLCIAQILIFITMTDQTASLSQFSQYFRYCWLLIAFAISCFVIKDNFFKHFFVWLIIAGLGQFIFQLGQMCEYYLDFSHKHPYFISIAVQLMLIFSIAYPSKMLYKKYLEHFFENNNNKLWDYIWIFPFVFFVNDLLWSLIFGELGSIELFSVRFATFVGEILSLVLFFTVMKKYADDALYIQNIENDKIQLEIQKKQFAILKENIDISRRQRHDLRHHIRLLRSYLDKNDIENIRNYLNKYEQEIPKTITETYCQNDEIDSIVKYYSEKCIIKNIDTDIKLNFPKELPSEYQITDICIMLSNILENALNATEKCAFENKHIKIIGYLKENMIIFGISNTCNEKSIEGIKDFSIFDNDIHGIGIHSIKTIVNKYNGDIKFEQNKTIFRVSLMLCSSVTAASN